MKPVSLQGRLTGILMGLTVLVWLFSIALTALQARRIIDQQIEDQLATSVDLALHTLKAVQADPAIAEHFRRRAVMVPEASLTRLTGYGFDAPSINLWFGAKQIIVGEATPTFPPPVAEGFVTAQLADGDDAAEWRILYRRQRSLDIWVVAGVNLRHAQRMAADVLWRSVIPLLFLLPTTTAILIVGIRRGLRPLKELADTIAARHSLALEPIEMTAVPAEIQPVVVALNGLLNRLGRVLASEQRFTANAAHELQTPLAAIKAEVQRYQRQARDDETQRMLDRIDTRVSRATATVTQLLTLARLDQDQEFQREPVDLSELVLEVMAEVGGMAMDRQLAMHFDAPAEPVRVAGQPDWLHILVRNLLLNALQHATAPGTIDIELGRREEQTVLSFSNDCEPISDSDFERLPERFFRPMGKSAPGVGLGLSIVRRIASLHGAELHLDRNAGERGFTATVSFSPIS